MIKKFLALSALCGAIFTNSEASNSFFCGGGLMCDWSKIESICIQDGSRHSENLSMIGGVLLLGSWIDVNASLWRFGGVINLSLAGSESSKFNLSGHEVETKVDGISPGIEFRAGYVIGKDGSIVHVIFGGDYRKSKLERKTQDKVTVSRVCPKIGIGFLSRVSSSNKIGWGADMNYCFRNSGKGDMYELKEKNSVDLKVYVTVNSL